MTQSARERRTRSLYFLGLAFIVFAYFYRVLSCSEIFVERDLSAFFIPPKVLWVRLLRSGIFPFWNPHQYAGIPLLAVLQPGVLYPPHIFYLLLPFPVVWNWLIILHFLLAGIGVYLFLKHMQSSDEGAFVGSVVFVLSGYLLSVHNLLPHLFAVAWFPFVLLYALKYFELRQARHLALTSLFLLMQFLSGAPEILMMSVLALGIISLFPPSLQDSYAGFFFRVRSFLFIVALFLLLSAAQLLPFYEVKALSIRQSGLSYVEASIWSMAWRDFIQFFIPDPFGNLLSDQKYWQNQSWLKTIYLGVVPFFLSAFYFVTADRRRWVFGVLMIISLVFALGGNTPVYQLLYRVPPFSSVRYPVKFLFLFFFMISVTSGLGLDRLRKGVEEQSVRMQRIILVAFYMGFLFALVWGYLTVFRDHAEALFDAMGFKPDAYNLIKINIHDIRRFSFFSFLFSILLLLYLRVSWKRLTMALIMILLTLDLFLANYGFYSNVRWDAYMSEHQFANEMEARGRLDRYFLTPKTHKTHDRFPHGRAVLSAAYAPLFGAYAAEGAEVLRLDYYEQFTHLWKSTPSLKEATRFLDIAGVRYIISATKIEVENFAFLSEMTVNDKPVYLYEYTAFPGRFLLYSQVVSVPDENSMMQKLVDRSVDLRKEVVVLSKEARPLGRSSPGGKVEVVSYEPNRVLLNYDAPEEAFLYASDVFYPGWRAYVDGRRTEVMRANVAFRAIKVPPGRHTVTFRYVPMSFYGGLALTCIGIILCVVMLVRKRK